MNHNFYEQTYGVEIEMTGISRRNAAKVIANYFGTSSFEYGGTYREYRATSRDGRIWKAMSDSSILSEGGCDNQTEVVTPIMKYDDLDDLQNVIRALRSAGAKVNSSCGIHVHIGADKHNAYTVTRLCNMMLKRQNLIYEALEIGARADRWCRKLNGKLVSEMQTAEKTKSSFEPVWYGAANEGGSRRPALGYHSHYDPTRYHGINLHAWYTKGTIEFRLFNGTLHAGKIKAYVQFCLAMSTYALGQEENGEYFLNARFENTDRMTPDRKYNAMVNFLENRLGLKGKEFATCRLHLTSALAQAANIAA